MRFRYCLTVDDELAPIRLFKYLASIIEKLSPEAPNILLNTGVKCRRRPGKVPCNGEVVAVTDETKKEIRWECLVCHGDGIITGWQNTK